MSLSTDVLLYLGTLITTVISSAVIREISAKVKENEIVIEKLNHRIDYTQTVAYTKIMQ